MKSKLKAIEEESYCEQFAVEDKEECSGLMDGVLDLGLTAIVNKLYYHVIGEVLYFDSKPGIDKTNEFLHQIEDNKYSHEALIIYLKYFKSGMRDIQTKVANSIQ